MKKVERGTGITKRQNIETEDFELHFELADQIEARYGREPDWFDFVAFAVVQWSEDMLKAATGELESDSGADFARRILQAAAQVRMAIEKGQPDRAAYYAVEFGELKTAVIIKGLYEPTFIVGEQHRKTQKKKAERERTRNGVTPEDREKRDKSIREHFERLRHPLTVNAFAEKYSTKYCLKPRTIREILSKHVGA